MEPDANGAELAPPELSSSLAKPSSLHRFDHVSVTWEDSASPTNRWAYLEGMKLPSAFAIRTSGFVLRADDLSLVIAQSLSAPDDDGDVQVNGVTAIPTSAILGICRVTPAITPAPVLDLPNPTPTL